jgi:hypothetical protein
VRDGYVNSNLVDMVKGLKIKDIVSIGMITGVIKIGRPEGTKIEMALLE